MRIHQEFLNGLPNLEVYSSLLFPSPSSATLNFLHACFYPCSSLCANIPASKNITEVLFSSCYSLLSASFVLGCLPQELAKNLPLPFSSQSHGGEMHTAEVLRISGQNTRSKRASLEDRVISSTCTLPVHLAQVD